MLIVCGTVVVNSGTVIPLSLKVVAPPTTNLIRRLTVPYQFVIRLDSELIRKLIFAVASAMSGSPSLRRHRIGHCNIITLYS